MKIESDAELLSTCSPDIGRRLFALVILSYCIYISLMQADWVFGGEMWAEMATNYFLNASAPTLYNKLLSTDAGYIPFPQRILALAAYNLNLPYRAIPYFYTWTSIILSSVLVGVFCLVAFRRVIRSDYFRFAICIFVLLLADFETRTFINFTYFSAFFVSVVCALILTSSQVPAWTFVAPFFFLSKPAILGGLPLILVAGFLRKGVARWLAVISFLLSFLQIYQIWISAGGSGGVRVNIFHTTVDWLFFLTKFIGFFFTGVGVRHLVKDYLNIFGIVFCILVGVTILNRDRGSSILVISGFTMLVFSSLLTFLSLRHLNSGSDIIFDAPMIRWSVAARIGFILSLAGIIQSWLCIRVYQNLTSGIIIFIIWMVVSGWLGYAIKNNQDPSSPVVQNSQWQSLASYLQHSKDPVCVPIDPFGWVYGRGCRILNSDMNLSRSLQFSDRQRSEVSLILSDFKIENASALSSIAVLVKPYSLSRELIHGVVTITTVSGELFFLSGEKSLRWDGGLIYFSSPNIIQLNQILEVKIKFSEEVFVATTMKPAGSNVPGVMLFGF
jgi:hypothetical protein